MRVAVMSDIHGNPAALLNVLEDMDHEGVDEIVCCGDVVGYGPDPVGAIELLRGREIPVVMGNHDAAVAGLISPSGFIDDARRGIRRHRRELGREELNWLKSLPYLHEGDGFVCAHGDLSCPADFNYILGQEDAVPSLQCRPERVCFVGHTHVSAVFVQIQGTVLEMPRDVLAFRVPDDMRFVVNVGSVGYPRSDPWSTYVVYDTDQRQIRFHRLPFDFERYHAQMCRRRIREPEWLTFFLRHLAQSTRDL